MKALYRTDDEVIVSLTREEFNTLSLYFPSVTLDWEEYYKGKIALLNLDTRERNSLLRNVYAAFVDKTRIRPFQRKDGSLMAFEEWIVQENLLCRLEDMKSVGRWGARKIAKAIQEAYISAK